MKKTTALFLLLVAILTVSKVSYASNTLFLGRTIAGDGTSYDYINQQSYHGDLNNYLINFTDITEIKKIKIDVDYEFGDFKYKPGPPSMELVDVQAGFPFFINDKGLVYLTLGALNYAEYNQVNPKHDARGNMLGLDIVCTPTDRFQFEVNLQQAIWGGTSKLNYDLAGMGESKDSPLNLTTIKVKIQYTFTDNLGIAIHHRLFDYNVNNPNDNAVSLSSTSMGLIYRF